MQGAIMNGAKRLRGFRSDNAPLGGQRDVRGEPVEFIATGYEPLPAGRDSPCEPLRHFAGGSNRRTRRDRIPFPNQYLARLLSESFL
jgi:hypothetical protein